jgi:hypothetical protein
VGEVVVGGGGGGALGFLVSDEGVAGVVQVRDVNGKWSP